MGKNQEKKPYTWDEYAEDVLNITSSMAFAARQLKKAEGRISELPKPKTVREQAICEVATGTTNMMLMALETITKILELYNGARHVIARRNDIN